MGSEIAIVTGGGGGIGKAVVSRFLSSGMTVAAFDIDAEALSACEAGFASEHFFTAVCDVTSEASVQAAVDALMERYGRIDVLVNNAGGSLGVSQPVDRIDGSDWDRVVSLNLKSMFLCTKAVLPVMKRQHYGRIVNVASMAGRGRSVLGGAPYAAAKAGVIGFTRHVSMDLGQYGIAINAVAPGTVLSGARVEALWSNGKTEAERQAFLSANPLGRLGTTGDVAAAVSFLSSREAAYITGAVLDVNGGSWVG